MTPPGIFSTRSSPWSFLRWGRLAALFAALIPLLATMEGGVAWGSEDQSSDIGTVEGTRGERDLILDDVARRHGLYFTVEQMSSKPLNRTVKIRMPVGEGGVTNVQTVIQAVREAYPGFEVRSSDVRSNVVHLVAKELASDPDHPVSQVLPQYSFTGLLPLMIADLEERQPRLKPQTFLIIGGHPDETRCDGWTFSGISVTNSSVRNILTQAVPLEGYYWLIWVAITNDKTGVTTVRYLGQADPQDARRAFDKGREQLFQLTNSPPKPVRK